MWDWIQKWIGEGKTIGKPEWKSKSVLRHRKNKKLPAVKVKNNNIFSDVRENFRENVMEESWKKILYTVQELCNNLISFIKVNPIKY